MSKELSRRAALTGVAAFVPAASATALPADTGDEPFIAVLAKFRECDAILDRYCARALEEHGALTEVEHQSPFDDWSQARITAQTCHARESGAPSTSSDQAVAGSPASRG